MYHKNQFFKKCKIRFEDNILMFTSLIKSSIEENIKGRGFIFS